MLGVAEALPFADAAFDLVVTYNVLMDVADMPAAVAEIGRVLTPRGRLCACVTQPFTDAGRWDHDGRFVVADAYLGGPRAVHEVMEREELRMTFDGTAFALEDYARALEAAGLAIEAVREPADAAGSAKWRRMPMFLMLRARRVPM